MRTREKAMQLFDTLTEEQLKVFILLFQNSYTPNAETIDAMQEADIIAHDASVEGYTNITDLMEALDAE
ncbi:MAG: hypothetical protein LIO74_08670 [Ruminococcus sp.]|nr:hypothetical protein [Ruminococcus sp.]MCD7960079.1 hypothetical protein [Ruminococcus sp.]